MSTARRAGRIVPWIALAIVVVLALALAARTSSSGDSAEARVERITSQLRCPTCQGLAVADSPASTARAISEDVRRRVEAGESDDEIKRAYVDRYGEWILLRPRSSGIATVVWALPIVVVVGAAALLGLTFRRWKREPTLRATDADRSLVEEALHAPDRSPDGDEASP